MNKLKFSSEEGWDGEVELVATRNPTIKLRKAFSEGTDYANVLAVISPVEEKITISTNGKINMSFDEYEKMQAAFSKATDFLIELMKQTEENLM